MLPAKSHLTRGRLRGENKMANANGSVKQKIAVSWFEFLFDTTGDVLRKHLEDSSAGSFHFSVSYCELKYSDC